MFRQNSSFVILYLARELHMFDASKSPTNFDASMPDGVMNDAVTFADDDSADSVPELEPATATTELANPGQASTEPVREPWPDVHHVEQFLMVAIGAHRVSIHLVCG